MFPLASNPMQPPRSFVDNPDSVKKKEESKVHQVGKIIFQEALSPISTQSSSDGSDDSPRGEDPPTPVRTPETPKVDYGSRSGSGYDFSTDAKVIPRGGVFKSLSNITLPVGREVDRYETLRSLKFTGSVK